MRSRSIALAVLFVAFAHVDVGSATATTSAQSSRSLTATFDVVNTNRSLVPCLSDGKRYRVTGDLFVPRRATKEVTLYIHGAGGNHYRYGMIDPRYDFPAQLAKRGHASLTLDMLGYGRSDHVDGNSVCIGSEADIAHQVIGQLRKGTYDVDRGKPVRFGSVFIGGHSSGGWIAEVEAYSFHDADGLVMLDSADLFFDLPWAVDPITTVGLTCAQGGLKEKPNYSYSWSSREAMADDMFFNVDPRIRRAFIPRVEPDPCADRESIGIALVADQSMIATIDVPTLVITGGESMAMKPPAGEIQCLRYLSSPSCTFKLIPNTAHMLHLERTASTSSSSASS